METYNLCGSKSRRARAVTLGWVWLMRHTSLDKWSAFELRGRLSTQRLPLP
jgi:hypothetical protein